MGCLLGTQLVSYFNILQYLALSNIVLFFSVVKIWFHHQYAALIATCYRSQHNICSMKYVYREILIQSKHKVPG